MSGWSSSSAPGPTASGLPATEPTGRYPTMAEPGAPGAPDLSRSPPAPEISISRHLDGEAPRMACSAPKQHTSVHSSPTSHSTFPA